MDNVLDTKIQIKLTLSELEDITLAGLSEDLEHMKVTRLYKAFFYGLKAMQHDITLDDAYKLIDELYEEGMELEEFFKIVLGEYSNAMGLGKKFKEILEAQK